MIKRVILMLILFCVPTGVLAQVLTLASTTSTQNSGLYEHILPQFTDATGIEVRVVAVGTGQALRIARNGDADVLLVHHRQSEDQFVADGYGIERFDVMFNDFVIIGPRDDPAGIQQAENLNAVMAAIADAKPIFLSRGDDSGTHKRETELWAAAGVMPDGRWYREIGSGMGATLNMASAVGGYTLSDRGTWLAFGNKGDLDLLYSDSALRNPYGLIVVNPARHPHVNVAAAQAFAQWMLSDAGQEAIGSLRVAGKQLFCPNAYPEDMADQLCPAQ